jgi:hypothetical protein
MDNSNNGLITKIWGPPAWKFLHCVSFGYPIEPTEQQKQDYLNFFTNIKNILPCKYCRISYEKFITEGCTKLDKDTMKNRDSLTRWFYNIHEKVNHKLDVVYETTYDDVQERYESFRAKCSKTTDQKEKGCIVPLDKKAESFKKSSIDECSIISYDIAKKFITYAIDRGFNKENFNIVSQCSSAIDTKSTLWLDRNKKCREQIDFMRIERIASIEESGKYKDLPTIDELKLILMLCSNLSNDQLKDIIKKLPYSRTNREPSYTIKQPEIIKGGGIKIVHLFK